MTVLFSLAGKRALVTGSSGGIGAAIAAAFADAGAELFLTDETDACVAQAEALIARGIGASALAADLSRPPDVTAIAQHALKGGCIDVLVCNAGVEGPVGPLHNAVRGALDAVFEINLQSAVALCGALIPRMAEAGGGSVILMSSIAGLRGNKRIGAYGMTKAALAELARNLAVEWGPANVRVNAISPGLIRTPLAESILADKAYLERRLSLTPLRRPGDPEEIAGAAVFLASCAGGFVTGHNLVIDGGTTISDGN